MASRSKFDEQDYDAVNSYDTVGNDVTVSDTVYTQLERKMKRTEKEGIEKDRQDETHGEDGVDVKLPLVEGKDHGDELHHTKRERKKREGNCYQSAYPSLKAKTKA